MSTLQVNSITGSEGQPLDQWLTTWLGKAGNWAYVDRINRPDYLGQNQSLWENNYPQYGYYKALGSYDVWYYANVDLMLMTDSAGAPYYTYIDIYATKDSTFANYTIIARCNAYTPNGNFQGSSYFVPKGHWYKATVTYGGARTIYIVPIDAPGRSV